MPGNGDVPGIIGIYGRKRQCMFGGVRFFIMAVVFGKKNEGISFGIEVDSALQFDGAGDPETGRNDDRTTSFLAYGGNGVVYGLGIQCLSVGSSAEVGNAYFIIGELRLDDLFHGERQSVVDRVGYSFCRPGLKRQ